MLSYRHRWSSNNDFAFFYFLVILPSACLKEIELEEFKVKWTIRHLETLVCRGILTKKSFIVKLVKA